VPTDGDGGLLADVLLTGVRIVEQQQVGGRELGAAIKIVL
jgi:hypothetical protein